MKIWGVANLSQGSGKTTTVLSLAGEIAAGEARVLLIDADADCALTKSLGVSADDEGGLYALFQAASGGDAKAGIRALLKSTGEQQITLLPGSAAITGYEKKLVGHSGMGRVLADALSGIASDYDYVLIDSPRTLSVVMVNILSVVQCLVMPVVMSVQGGEDEQSLLQLLKRVEQGAGRNIPYLVVPSRHKVDDPGSEAMMRTLEARYAGQLWQAFIPEDPVVGEARQQGKTLASYQPKSRSAVAYRHLYGTLAAL